MGSVSAAAKWTFLRPAVRPECRVAGEAAKSGAGALPKLVGEQVCPVEASLLIVRRSGTIIGFVVWIELIAVIVQAGPIRVVIGVHAIAAVVVGSSAQVILQAGPIGRTLDGSALFTLNSTWSWKSL